MGNVMKEMNDLKLDIDKNEFRLFQHWLSEFRKGNTNQEYETWKHNKRLREHGYLK